MTEASPDSSHIREAFRFFQGCNGSSFTSNAMEPKALHHGKALNGLVSNTAFPKAQPPVSCNSCSSNGLDHPQPNGKKKEFKSVIHVTQTRSAEASENTHVTQSRGGEPSETTNSMDCKNTGNCASLSHSKDTIVGDKTEEEVVSKKELKHEATSESVCSSGTSGDISSSSEQESQTEAVTVVMRKHKKSTEKDEGKTSVKDEEDSTQTVGRPPDEGDTMPHGRETCKVVSDAFDFLRDGVEGGESLVRDSGIPLGGGEDKIFNRLLTLDEATENQDTQNGNSTNESNESNHSIISGRTTEGFQKHINQINHSGNSSTVSGIATEDCQQHNNLTSNDSNNSTISGRATEDSGHGSSPVNKRKGKRHGNASVNSAENSEDSEDDDTGIYNESFRKSVWLCVPEEKGTSQLQATSIAEESESDEVFLRGVESSLNRSHKRSDSTTTTHSESEFKHEYRLRRKCMVHRHDSQQEYHRMSANVYEHEKLVVIVKEEKDTDFGLHIYDSHPAVITDVDSGSPAYRAGLRAGQVLLSVNGSNALELSHQEIIQLIQKDSTMVKLEVASSGDLHHIRNQQTPVFSGFMCKQSNSTFVKNWRRRYFVLRFDNCLYYYKGEQDQDPLGAIPLLNYIVSKQTDSSKEHCFKAEKFGARTYYFIADSRDDMINWISTLNEAATRAKEKKDAWMDVTACNVGLPALDIKKPDCFGYLSKCGRTVKAWRKRYCVLKDACIYYYKNVNSANAQGMAHLHGYQVEPMTSTLKRHGFLLKPPEPQMRTFSFCAENETDQKRWMTALEKSIQRWIKVD